jgi:hypothetical protein
LIENTIKDVIEANITSVEYKNNDIIILHSELRNKVFNFIENINDEEIDTKELIKIAVREAFELKLNDIIIVKKEQIFIKIFEDSKRKKISSSEKDTIAGRFNGIDEQELDSFYDEYFSKEERTLFFKLVVKALVEKYFYEEQIDNLTYEKNIFQYIQLIIIDQLRNDFDCSDDFSKGFSGYIFRIHFKDVFEYISDYMLNEISSSNEYMIDFLKYYSLDIVIVNGIKYRVPELEADGGLKWNVISMLSIAKIYTRTRILVRKLKKEISVLDEKILVYFKNNINPVAYNKVITAERLKQSRSLDKVRQTIMRYEDSLKIEKREKEKVKINTDINKLKREINQINKDIERLENKEIKRIVLDKYQKLERQMDIELRELKSAEKIMLQNEKGYQSIKKSLLKALISKKKRI